MVLNGRHASRERYEMETFTVDNYYENIPFPTQWQRPVRAPGRYCAVIHV